MTSLRSTAPFLRASLQEQREKNKEAFAQAGEQWSAAAVGKHQRDARWQRESRFCEASPDSTPSVGVASYTSVSCSTAKMLGWCWMDLVYSRYSCENTFYEAEVRNGAKLVSGGADDLRLPATELAIRWIRT